MIDLKTFRKIKELKEKGVTTKRILEELNISKGMYINGDFYQKKHL